MHELDLIPEPVQVSLKSGYFMLGPTTRIVHDDEHLDVAELLHETRLVAIGIRVPVFRDRARIENFIMLRTQQDLGA